MTDISSYLRKINSTAKKDREESLTTVLTFLEDKDVYLDTEEMRRIKSFVLIADTPKLLTVSFPNIFQMRGFFFKNIFTLNTMGGSRLPMIV